MLQWLIDIVVELLLDSTGWLSSKAAPESEDDPTGGEADGAPPEGLRDPLIFGRFSASDLILRASLLSDQNRALRRHPRNRQRAARRQRSRASESGWSL